MNAKSPNPIDEHVGSRVKMRRMMLGMSQEKLGDALNLTFQQVQKYEKGKNRIGASRLQQIAGILKVPVSFFFEGSPGSDGGDPIPTPGADITAQLVNTPDGIAVAAAFVQIGNPIVRRHARRTVELLAELGKAAAEARLPQLQAAE